MRLISTNTVEITHFTLCCGLGGISAGFNQATAELKSGLGKLTARMRCLGGIDSDPAACRDFERITGTPATCLDLFDRGDHTAFHGKAPPADWREVTPADILAAAGGQCPDILAWSPPCKGFSGLLNKKSAKSQKYQALNRLTLRILILSLEAFKDDPPSLIVMENVPRIASRGRALLEAIKGVMRSYGYACAESFHDCGKIGGLAQHRRRFLLVGRHIEKVKPFLYEPGHKPMKTVGEVIGDLPMPEADGSGSMHRLPRMQWQTWMRLALIEAGKDWRSLAGLKVVDGELADIRVVPLDADWHAGVLGVREWEGQTGTVTGGASSTRGAFSVADPRCHTSHKGNGKYRVTRMDEAAGAVVGASTTGNGAHTIADPRLKGVRHSNVYKLIRWDEASGAVTGGHGPSSGGQCVADPRPTRDLGSYQPYGLQPWNAQMGTVTGRAAAGGGTFSVADPRPGWSVADPRPGWTKKAGGDWSSTGHYGVTAWDGDVGTVIGNAKYDRGSWSVADRRLPAPTDRPKDIPLIISFDGSWHRPFTTAELWVLQGGSFWDAMGKPTVLDGKNTSHWRMRIGNAVPIGAAAAIGSTMAHTLLMQFAQISFSLTALPIWCRPLGIGLSIDRSLN